MENLKFDNKDVIKLIGFCSVVLSMWYDLKSDLRTFKATTELRLIQLEKERDNRRPRTYSEMYAVIPNQIELQDEH